MLNPKDKGTFILVRSPAEGAQVSERGKYRVRFEQGMILSLVCAILVFGVSRRMGQREIKGKQGPYIISSVDIIPVTKYGGIPRRPTLPQVPIPSEDERLPDDETIDTTELDLTKGLPFFDGFGDGVPGGLIVKSGSGPRPIREVIPEYPEDERKRGVEGVVELAILVNSQGGVDSVRVVLNTTNSRLLERSAVQAAFRSRYMPAKREGKKISRWIQRPYRFEKK
jgi:TonB family protein